MRDLDGVLNDPKTQTAMQDAIRKLVRGEAMATDFFAAAFLEATGLKATEAEMVVENLMAIGDGKTMGRRIFFRPLGSLAVPPHGTPAPVAAKSPPESVDQ